MATIQVKRKKEWFGRHDKAYVLIDRIRRGELSNGGSIDIEVPEGRHLIQIESTDGAYTSPLLKLHVCEGEIRCFMVCYPKSFNWIVVAGLGLVMAHSVLKYVFHTEAFFLLILAAVPFSILLYFATVGRYRALRLIPECPAGPINSINPSTQSTN
ncbi:MAG: hypothetical protein J5I94_28235 [Phaeodactylibacter sp.]|nr:hypothetical protein [Phaeodactylibacter sp.]